MENYKLDLTREEIDDLIEWYVVTDSFFAERGVRIGERSDSLISRIKDLIK